VNNRTNQCKKPRVIPIDDSRDGTERTFLLKFKLNRLLLTVVVIVVLWLLVVPVVMLIASSLRTGPPSLPVLDTEKFRGCVQAASFSFAALSTPSSSPPEQTAAAVGLAIVLRG